MSYSGETRFQLRFHNHLYQKVEIWKTGIQEKFSKNLIFIGVHCRRGDFIKYLKKGSGANVVDYHFFDAAFDIYRQKYNDVNNKVIFLAVSEDVTWIKLRTKLKKDFFLYSFDFV